MNRTLLGAIVVFVALAFVLTSASLGTAQGATVLPGQAATPAVSSPCAQTLVHLGTASHFRILAATTVTSTGNTVVRGNLGVSPGTAVTGFPPGKVTGTMHVNDTTALSAQADLLMAFNNASARTHCETNVSGNLGGSTLSPGLYVSTSSLAISSGNLTLNAHGHPNAVFIFVMASTFTTSTGLSVILTGGANATHVFWIVGSSATVGTLSSVSGSILAYASITLTKDAILHGSALALNGAVTLDANQVRT
jgi:hypothetical protein